MLALSGKFKILTVTAVLILCSVIFQVILLLMYSEHVYLNLYVELQGKYSALMKADNFVLVIHLPSSLHVCSCFYGQC